MPDDPREGTNEERTSERDDVAFEELRAEQLRQVVARKSLRRERARGRRDESIWTWIGTFGIVGWTVVVPTLAGLAFGIFVDNHVDSSISFTITFLVAGAAVGASMAWVWIRQESPRDDEQ